ncbi:MAG: Cys-rich repeat protein [Myxococcota bacterium]|jgi:Cys-rich repeat protein
MDLRWLLADGSTRVALGTGTVKICRCDDWIEQCQTADSNCDAGTCEGNGTCTSCADSTVGGIDAGCAAVTPACDTTQCPAQCEQCASDADCAEGVCDTGSNLCVTCRDNSFTVDAGCAADRPICNETSGPTPYCVECRVDTDCSEDACNSMTGDCAPCVDDTAIGADRGCSVPLPFCNDSGQTPVCVACVVDTDCPPGVGCNAGGECGPCVDDAVSSTDTGCADPLPVCANENCLVCEDNAGPGQSDFGCGGTTPICIVTGITPTCVECTSDDDCPGVCDLNSNSCTVCDDDSAGGVDTGCSIGNPACIVSTGKCSECTVNADCPSGLCDVPTNTCAACADDSAGGVDTGCNARV